MSLQSNYSYLIGKKIHINYMDGEPRYAGREGIVNEIDSEGQIHGTWGGLALNMGDDFYTIPDETN